MCAGMLRIIFCLLTAVFLNGEEQVENQDVIEYFSPVKLVDLQWKNPNTKEEFKSMLNTNYLMIAIDVTNDGKVYGEEFAEILEIFLEHQKNQTDSKKGLVYKFDTYNAFLTINLYFKRSFAAGNLAPFPQWFHIKCSFVGDVDLSSNNKFNQYTFSFEQDDGNFESCKGKADDVHIDKKVYFITTTDPAFCSVDGCDGLADNTLLTVKYTELELKQRASCLANLMQSNCKDRFLLDMPQNLKTHFAMCAKIKPLLPGAPAKTTTWKLITDISELKGDIKENIIKVDVVGRDFLGTNFENFIKQFQQINNADEKGLQFDFKTMEAFSAFLRLEQPFNSFKDITTLKIGLKFDIEVYTNVTMIRNDDTLTQIISCYSVAVSAEKGSGPYTEEEITNLQTILDTLRNDMKSNVPRNGPMDLMLSLDLKRISSTEETQIIKLFDTPDTKKSFTNANNISKEETRDAMRKLSETKENIEDYYFEYDSEVQEEISSSVSITDLVADLSKDLTLLNFIAVKSKSELALALEDEKRMLELAVSCPLLSECTVGDNIDFCHFLKQVGLNHKNAIKLKFKNKRSLKMATGKACFKYLNFPVWLEIVVPTSEDAGTVDLKKLSEDDITALKQLGHKIILHPKKISCQDDTDVLGEQRIAIKNILDVGFYIEAVDLVEHAPLLQDFMKIYNPEIILSLSPEDILIAKELREKLKPTYRYYARMQDKLILEECPPIEFGSSNLLKTVKIADFTELDALPRLVELFEMVRVTVRRSGDNLYVDEKQRNSLQAFLGMFEDATANGSKCGIIFAFNDNAAYTKTMRTPEIKTYNHPIWFQLKIPANTRWGVIDEYYCNNEDAIGYCKFNDKLDCRTLVLKIDASDNYSQANIDELAKYADIGHARVHAFDPRLLNDDGSLIKSVKNVLIQADAGFIFNAQQFRKKLAGMQKTDIAFDFSGSRKFAAQECPTNDIFTYFPDLKPDDLSTFTLSNYIKSLDDIEAAVDAGNHLLNVRLTTKDGDVMAGDGLSLLDLLEHVNDFEAAKKIGLKLEFDETQTFETAVNNPLILYYIKNIKRPIWFSANVIGEGAAMLNHEMNNDVLDCRTIALGWTGSGSSKYSEQKLLAMKELKMGEGAKLYTVEMIHLLDNFDSIKRILLTTETVPTTTTIPTTTTTTTTTTTRSKRVEAAVPNGNKLMVSLKEEQVAQLMKMNTDKINAILGGNRDILIFDMPHKVKMAVFASGAGALNSGLFVILATSLGLLMLQL